MSVFCRRQSSTVCGLSFRGYASYLRPPLLERVFSQSGIMHVAVAGTHAIVCVYVSIQLYCSCCHYGVIKHDDDDDYCTATSGQNVRLTVGDADVSYV